MTINVIEQDGRKGFTVDASPDPDAPSLAFVRLDEGLELALGWHEVTGRYTHRGSFAVRTVLA